MSLTRLAADSVTRRVRRSQVQGGTARTTGAAAPADGTPDKGATVTGALSAIEKFVPTEIVGIYVAAAAILVPLADAKWTLLVASGWFALCLVLTPTYYWISFATQFKRRTGTVPRLAEVPLWPVLAASVAFVVWGLAVSQVVSAPLLCVKMEPTSPACVGHLAAWNVLVLLIAPLLGAIDNLVNAKTDDAPPAQAVQALGP